MHSFLTNAQSYFASNKRTRNSQPKVSSGYQVLEGRRVLASIFLNAAGELFISGGSGNDVGVLVASGDQIEASITGTESQTFDASEVEAVTFIGGDGNDTLTNSTDIRSSFLAAMVVIRLPAGQMTTLSTAVLGSDNIVGGRGNDVLIGGLGDDVISGGGNNDRIFGSAGQNRLIGNGGDDVIFGGDEADRIFGGPGIDQIYGLGGDDF